jgi:hypothetical protein
MFTGEFDTSNLPLNTFPDVSYILFIGFVVMISAVLLNLLYGLALNDIAAIEREAETRSLAARVIFIPIIEKCKVFFV